MRFEPGGPDRYAQRVRSRTTEEAFDKRIQKVGDCWIWTGTTNERKDRPGHAYGIIWLQDEKRSQLVHRYSYERFVGPLVEGMQIDHVVERGCTSKLCANPAHLEQVTHAENQQRVLSSIGMCRRGHPRTPENDYIFPNSGRHQCRVCVREGKARNRLNKAAK